MADDSRICSTCVFARPSDISKHGIERTQYEEGGSDTAYGIEFVGAFLASLFVTFFLLPWLIPRLKQKGIVGRDLNKPDKPEIAEMGGIAVVVGFLAGVSAIIALDGITDEDLLIASLSAIMGAAFVGMIDDLFDLPQGFKALLPFVIALPFATAVSQEVVIPHVAIINLGPWMVLAAAFAMTCAANAANMLEGFNGLGTGLGIVMSFTLLVLSIIHDRLDGIYVLVPLIGALVAFLWFNKHPAEVFPGDTMTLFMGATLAAAGLLSSLHVQTAVIFLPMIIEFALKVRGRFSAENYAQRSANGLLIYQGKIESLTHVFMRYFKVSEQTLVYWIWTIEVAICAIVIAVDLSL
ncbi:MAG TPA: hypothetical protein VGB78_02590 [Thermoplasmata archaeon]